MPSNATETRIIADKGPVADAVRILAESLALRDHVRIQDDGDVIVIRRTDNDVPYELWGSGAQQLWLLVGAIAARRYEVSLYAVVERLDMPNRAAVAAAVTALCAG